LDSDSIGPESHQIRIRSDPSPIGFGFDRIRVLSDSDSIESEPHRIRIRSDPSPIGFGFDRVLSDSDSIESESHRIRIRSDPNPFDSDSVRIRYSKQQQNIVKNSSVHNRCVLMIDSKSSKYFSCDENNYIYVRSTCFNSSCFRSFQNERGTDNIFSSI
jgi:hypothetical protein